MSADFGDYSGNSDFGGDWGGGSDWGDDWSSSDYGSDGSFVYFYGGDGFGIAPTILIIAAIIVFLIIKTKLKNKNTPVRGVGAAGVDRATLTPASKYSQIDPNFSDNNFKEKLSNIYVQLQNGWTDKNIESLRPYFTDTAYAQFDRQLDSYRQNRQTNYIERITVLDVDLLGFIQDGTNDKMYAKMKTRIVDYVKDDSTGNIVRGSNKDEKFMEYEWELIRKTGVKTTNGAESHQTNCPNCGAPLNINHSAKCEYCGSILTENSYDWVISSIKAISQITA